MFILWALLIGLVWELSQKVIMLSKDPGGIVT